MSDGATTPTTQTAACTNCTEQDTITIAGKTFCANCGTPQTDGNSSDQSGVVAPGVSPSLNVDSHAPATVAPSQPMPSLIRSTPSSSQTAADTSSTIVQARLKADQLNGALNTEQSPSIAKFSTNTPQDSSLGSGVVAEAERSASEFTSLDDKSGESVMSDETLDELAKAADEPMPKDELPKQQTPVTDVKPAVVAEPSVVTAQASTPVASPSPLQAIDSKPQATSVNPFGQPTGVADDALTSSQPQPTTVTPVNTQPASIQPESPQQTNPAAPRQSNYRLDLTQAGSSSLPKAVSDIRPAASPAAPASSVGPVAPAMKASAAPTSQVQSPSLQTVASSQAVSPASTQTTPNALPETPVSPAPLPAVASVAANQPAPVTAANTGALTQSAQPSAPAKGLKASSVALSLVGLLLIGGYIWQVNYPNLALKVAGSKAGISANFPGYIPNGWKLSGNIQSSPGNISYNIANTKAGASLQVSESKTEWDSQALAENYVAPKASNYLALQAQGLTIYLYDGNQASWVNNGTWYRIEGSASGLSQDQIIKVATSL